MLICDEKVFDNPKPFINKNANLDVSDAIAHYLKDENFETVVIACAETDLLTGKRLEEASSVQCYSDGEFEWTSEIIYLFEQYGLKLDDRFIEKVKTML
ncbi:MAG: hypothetical protein IKH13_09035 [Clostridia bacterium]|nr:hypothetical protein [Clostridia bacterium]